MVLRYLKSLMIHKWWVFVAGVRIGVPLWRLIIHDASKFSRAEFMPYARYFSGKPRTPKAKADFDRAWPHHQNRNTHHWQHWILVYDDEGPNQSLPMPRNDLLEMVADWMGAGRAYTGTWDMAPWLEENLPRVRNHLHRKTWWDLGQILSSGRQLGETQSLSWIERRVKLTPKLARILDI